MCIFVEPEKSSHDNKFVGWTVVVRLQVEMGAKGIWWCWNVTRSIWSHLATRHRSVQQRWWQFWGDTSHKSYVKLHRKSRVAVSFPNKRRAKHDWLELHNFHFQSPGHLQKFMWDWCRIFPIWWTNVCNEVWKLDLWWVSGIYEYYIFTHVLLYILYDLV